MSKPRRIEIVTFAVALTAAFATFVVLELRKPGNGIFPERARVEAIVHKETGEVLLEGRTRLGALISYASNRRRALAEPAGSAPASRTMDLADLTGADLNNVDCSHSDISGLAVRDGLCNDADFRESLLIDADLAGTEFRRTGFGRAVVDKSNFSHAILRAARFTAASAQDTSFRKADLTDADFSGANLRGADFTGADLLGVLFSRSTDVAGALFVDTRNMSEEFREFAAAGGGRFETPETGVGRGASGAAGNNE